MGPSPYTAVPWEASSVKLEGRKACMWEYSGPRSALWSRSPESHGHPDDTEPLGWTGPGHLGNPTCESPIIWAPGWHSHKELSCQWRRCKRRGFSPWVRKISCRRKWQPTPVFLPETSHGQRSLAGYSPWGYKTVGHDWTHTHGNMMLALAKKKEREKRRKRGRERDIRGWGEGGGERGKEKERKITKKENMGVRERKREKKEGRKKERKKNFKVKFTRTSGFPSILWLGFWSTFLWWLPRLHWCLT